MPVLSEHELVECVAPSILEVDGAILVVRAPQALSLCEYGRLRAAYDHYQRVASLLIRSRSRPAVLRKLVEAAIAAMLDLLLEQPVTGSLRQLDRYLERVLTSVQDRSHKDAPTTTLPDYGALVTNLEKYYGTGGWWNRPLWQVIAGADGAKLQQEPPPTDPRFAMLMMHEMGMQGVYDAPG